MSFKYRLTLGLLNRFKSKFNCNANYQRINCILKLFKSSNSKFNSRSPVFISASILTALGIRKKEEEPEDPLIHSIKLGIFSMQKEEFNAAEQYLHLALKMAQERSDPQAVAYIYDILANLAFQNGEFKKAEVLFIEVMKHLVSTGKSETDNSIVEISLKLAAMFSKQGLTDRAQVGFEFCINTQQKKLDQMDIGDVSKLSELDKDTLLLWAMSIDWFARHLLSVGKLKEAQNYFEKAYSMSEKVNGKNHHQTLVLMNDIGSVATLRENYQMAIEFLLAAIERGRISESPDLGAFYCNLGATYMKKGDQGSAYSSCETALQLAKKSHQIEAEKDAIGCLEELQKLGFKN